MYVFDDIEESKKSVIKMSKLTQKDTKIYKGKKNT